MDKYLLHYITSFLILCNHCNKYTTKTPYICVICQEKYCKTCSSYLHNIYGFYCQYYCNNCYKNVI